MATIETLVQRIETRLFMVSGINVQIHAEEQLYEMLRSAYNTYFDDFWFPEFTYYREEQLDGTTGQVVVDLSADILRYKDINGVFFDQEESPLPRLSTTATPSRIRTRCMAPSSDPQKVFKVLPIDEVGPVHIWYRTRIADTVWDDQVITTEINMDDELLMHTVVHEFLVNDDSNASAIKFYEGKMNTRLMQMRQAQFQIPLNKRSLERDGPATRWE